MRMGPQKKHSLLARKVLAHIVQAYPEEKSGDASFTQSCLLDAIASLKPFEPEDKDKYTINRFLIHREASEVACRAAWALYKDFVVNKHAQ